MGDANNNQVESLKKETDSLSTPDNETNSPQPAETVEKTAVAVSNGTPTVSEEKIEKIHDRNSSLDSIPKKIDTVYEPSIVTGMKSEEKIRQKQDKKPENERKPLIDSLVPETKDTEDQFKGKFVSKSSPATPNQEKRRIGSVVSGFAQNERINRNQSDIFSLKEETTVASSIFSVNGSPSRKVYRRKEGTSSNVFPFGKKEEPPSEKNKDKVDTPKEKVRDTKESYNELRRPSSSLRNPLTGTGLSSNDEYKFKGNKRKDGNPLLGLGYSPEVTPSTHRIPPGGYSHKLW